MKKFGLLALLGLLVFALLFTSCTKPKPVIDEGPPPVVEPVDTTPAPQPPPPPPPPPKLQESQLMTVYFDFDKYNLRADAKVSLDHNYDLLKEFMDVIIKIEGHCDERGTIEYNLSLGDKRAKATVDYLVGLGINAGRLSVISYGKERPVDPGHNEDAWAKNRRCEFRIISQ
ncbi:MAG: peptidoglycan-associated lipoprotein Pal [candidate division Zixibacteria bacterium]|nr:peptidoglycan-associated lipoprotein Pal [candidate division Zixibacteria bacterium]